LALAAPSTLAIVAGALLLLMAARRIPAVRAVGAITAAALAIEICYFPFDQIPAGGATPATLEQDFDSHNDYAALHDPAWRAPDRDLYDGAVFLQRAVGRTLLIADGPVAFWYGETPQDFAFRSIQSIFLFAYSRVAVPALPRSPDAHLDTALRRELARYSNIAILSRTTAEGDIAMQALGNDGAVAHLRARFVFPGAWFGYTVTIVDYVPPSAPVGAEIAQIPLANLSAQNGASLNNAPDGSVELQTAPQQWAYSAIAPLHPEALLPGKLILRIRLRVLRGEIGVLVTPNISSPQVIEAGAGPTPVPRDVDLAIPDGSAEHLLVVRNWAVDGSSLVRILNVAVFRAPP